MGQEEIIKEIVRRGEVLQMDLHAMFGGHGPFSQQLKQLRRKNLAFRMKVPPPKHCHHRDVWMYFPTPEAVKRYGKEVSN